MTREYDELEIVNKIPLFKIIKEILARVFALYGLIIFFLSLLIISPAVTIMRMRFKDPELAVVVHKWFRGWMRFFTTAILSPIRIRGEEHFQPGENYIVACNHRSMMDVPVSTPFIPGANKTIAKKSMSKIPLFGTVYKAGSVLVNRKSERSRRKSYDEMKKVLAMGLHMCIYPEGTRNKTGMPLKNFRDGAFRLSVETGKKIIPAIIVNTSKVLPVDKTFYLWPAPLRIIFLEPVSPEGLTIEELNQKVFRIMWDALRKEKEKDKAKHKRRQ